MKVAVFGSRGIRKIDLSDYLPKNTKIIVSGGAIGVDRMAAKYAREFEATCPECSAFFDMRFPDASSIV
jgi:hypothetical protein